MPNSKPVSPARLPKAMPAVEETVVSGRQLWEAAIGQVFKLAFRSHGSRNVTYTQVKAVRDAEPVGSGAFEIEVLCVEVTARTVPSKRTHSNICKAGVLRQDADTELVPESFGVECPLEEFEKITSGILAYTNSYLDSVMQDPEDETAFPPAIDLPHLSLTDMEASLLLNSPFLSKNSYFLTANSVVAGLVAIEYELRHAQQEMQEGEAADPIYVAQKNEAIASLQLKLKGATQEMEALRILATVETQQRDNQLLERRRPAFASLQLDSVTLALLGKPSATSMRWMAANPSEEGPVFCLAGQFAPLDFVRWAHVSGRVLGEGAAPAGLKLTDFFKGWNQSYTGPNADGFYPLLKPGTT